MRLIGPGAGRQAAAQDGSTDPAAQRQHLRVLKTIVREQLCLTEDVPVVISELRCAEEDCAPVETVIAVLAAPTRTWKIPTPQAQVSPDALRLLLDDQPLGGHA